jgi:hypothetical protein
MLDKEVLQFRGCRVRPVNMLMSTCDHSLHRCRDQRDDGLIVSGSEELIVSGSEE